MGKYKVDVLLESSRFVDFGVFEMASIPDGTELGGVIFRQHTDEAFGTKDYMAETIVAADSESQAKLRGARKVERILSVLGAWNVPLKVEYPGAIASPFQAQPDSADVQADEDDELPVPQSMAWFRWDVEPERRALSWRDHWPDWLPVALDLNYLALMSSPKPAFVIRYAILELLEVSLLGKADIIMQRTLTQKQKRELQSDLDGLLANYGLDPKSRQRMVERTFQTESQAKKERFAALLQYLKIEADPTLDIQPIITMRNTIAHGAIGSPRSDVRIHRENLQRWVSTGLQYGLSNPTHQ